MWVGSLWCQMVGQVTGTSPYSKEGEISRPRGAITPSAFCLGWAEDSSPGQRVGLGLDFDFEDLQGASQPWRSVGHSFVLAVAMMVIKTDLSSL